MDESQHFKDHQRELRLFRARIVFMALAMLVLFCVLAYRYYFLQIINYLDYATQSDRNRIHVLPIPPTRGLIFDSKHRVLADNRPSYTLTIVGNNSQTLAKTIVKLRQIIAISAADLDRFYKLKKQQRHSLDPVPLRFKLTDDEIARLAVNQHLLDGVEVEAELVRNYPRAGLFAHVLGYTGRISERELQRFTDDQVQRYSGTRSIGKIGIEKSYEDVLQGEVGSQNVETNASGRVMRVLDREDPRQGKDLTLYLDADLQETAVVALQGHRGAVVAIDVKTGGVLAAVSNPGFDPNLFVNGIGYDDYRALNASPDHPLINRFLQGAYPPGSTVKPLMALAGLHFGVLNPAQKLFDPGYFMLPNVSRPYHDMERGGHGWVDLKRALAESCDTYFYDLGARMGIDNIAQFGPHFGLGQQTGIDIPHERSGIWPSRSWKRAYIGRPWYPGDTVNMAIGQGYVLATPLQLAVMVATIANRGKRMRPQLVKSIGGEPVTPVVEEQLDLSAQTWDEVIAGMAEVMRPDGHGTGRRLSVNANYSMAGKSGTAQVVGIPQGEKYDADALRERHRDHALFIAFAPVEDPKIAVAVIVENGELGALTAGPVARYMFDAYLDGRYLRMGEAIPEIGKVISVAATGQGETIQSTAAQIAQLRN